MYIDLYADAQYTQKIVRAKSENLFGSHSTVTLTTKTIDGVVYEYVSNPPVIIYDTLGSGGTSIGNAVTDPKGDAEHYFSYYLKGNKRLDVKCFYTKDDDSHWSVSMGFVFYANNISCGGYSINLSGIITVNPETEPQKYDIRFVSFVYNNKLYYGFGFNPQVPDIYISCTFVSENFFDTSVSKPYEGGSSGSNPDSGYGDNDTDSENATKIGGLNGILAGEGYGLHVYELSATAYSELLSNMLSQRLDLKLSRAIWDTSDSIISIHRLPTLSRSQVNTNVIRTGGFCNIDMTNTVKRDTTNIITVSSDPVSVGTIKNDFLDYTNTTAILYMPFCGSTVIPIEDIMSGSIQVIYEIDLVQGNCVCNVYTTNYQNREKLQGCYSGNCAYRIPIMGSTDGSGEIAGLIQTAVGVMTGNAAIAGSGIMSTYTPSLTPSVYSTGSTGGNSAYYSDSQCSLIIYRPNAIYPDNYANILGRPSGDSGKVSKFTGNFVKGQIKVDVPNATDAEKEEIRSLFNGGVYA